MPSPRHNPRSELSAALAACRKAFLGVALFSALLNILYLTGSFYMLEVYDRVLPSRSVPTLVGISPDRPRSLCLSGRAGRHPQPHPGAGRRLAG